jgi:hypothetical protein
MPLAASVASDPHAITVPSRPPQDEEPDAEDLRERIRLAAQRAIADSGIPDATDAKPVTVKSAPAKKAEAPSPPPRRPPGRGAEPKIFVPPRAPDDPGPEPGEGDGLAAGVLRPAKI